MIESSDCHTKLIPKRVCIEGLTIAIGDGPNEITWDQWCDFLMDWNKTKDLPPHD